MMEINRCLLANDTVMDLTQVMVIRMSPVVVECFFHEVRLKRGKVITVIAQQRTRLMI